MTGSTRRKFIVCGISISILVLTLIGSPQNAFAARNDIGKIMARAGAAAEQGDYKSAHAILDEELAKGKNPRILKSAQANIYFLEKKYSETEKLCLEVLKEDPNYAWPRLILLQTYFSLEENSKAEAQLELLKKSTQDPELLYEGLVIEGELLRKKKEYKKAAEVQKQAMQLNAEKLPAYELLSLNLRLLGKIRESEAELLNGLKYHPQDPRLLQILADHYRDRREYGNMQMYLEKMVKACGGDLAECERFKTAYRETGFINSGVGGYDLSAHTKYLPVTVEAENVYSAQVSNIENLLRALENNEVDRSDESLLVPPRLTPKNTLRFLSNIFIPNLPVLHFSVYYDQSLRWKDPLNERSIQEYKLETEKTTYLPVLGNTTFFPYVKYTLFDGADFSVTDIFADNFKIDHHSFGVRSLSSPIFGKFYVEPEYAFGFGNFRNSKRFFREHRGMIRLARVFEDQSRLVSTSQLYYANHNTHNNDFRLEQGFLIEKFWKNQNFMTGFDNTFIFHEDYLFERDDVRTIVYRPSLNFKIRPMQPLHGAFSISHFLGNHYHEYDHLTSNFEIGYRWNARFFKKIANQKLPYQLPLELVVGYKSDIFYRFPRSKEKWLDTVYARIKIAG